MQKTLKHEIKADYLLEKGIHILWSKGYNATSVNDIVMAAGVPKGSFYFYFDSKEDFAVKAIEKYFEAQFSPARKILENEDLSPKQRLLDFYLYRCTILKEEMDCKMGCLASNIGNEMSEHSESIRLKILEKETLVLACIREVVEEAQNRGEIDASLVPQDLVAFLEDAGKGAMITMKEMQSSYPVDNFLQMVNRVLFK
ncbi:TetR/AcrR family transcriptional regulator [Muriicola sp. Z0-33]|uniref:TetR/AcrR family transcriptional regulator n=1 Tax=Muriicola sp. Z0-33 TaxID=2816957 RepID=UPI002237B2BB|nr:TetR/AcrR family transcriptional regulator [Muriicola sp. Z0-33]MCW5516819.1 TetR/AcrR family transcriptional regulator [Muriicola sp. Z0-33]